MNRNHLDTLRRIHALSESADPLRQIDPDLSREAGMDGNYGRLLMAARDLDTAPPTVSPAALAEIRAALVDARDRLAGMTGVPDPLPRVRAALALLDPTTPETAR